MCPKVLKGHQIRTHTGQNYWLPFDPSRVFCFLDICIANKNRAPGSIMEIYLSMTLLTP